MYRIVLLVALPMVSSVLAAQATPAQSIARTVDERAVLAADARQRDAVASVDLSALRAISHRNLRVNAPSNRIISREDLVRMVGSGKIRNEVFERVPESVVVTGNIGVVMGSEVVFPGAASEQARMYGRSTLNRRYTNIFLRDGSKWLHLARHANIVAVQGK